MDKDFKGSSKVSRREFLRNVGLLVEELLLLPFTRRHVAPLEQPPKQLRRVPLPQLKPLLRRQPKRLPSRPQPLH